jgi:hypothetical protein
MSYAFNSAKSQLDKRTLGGVFPAPIDVPVTEGSPASLQDSLLELGLPTHESDKTTSYSLEVDGDTAGRVRGRGNSWHFISNAGVRSYEAHRSRKLAANALAAYFLQS